jgi:hydroxypyruvate reductase
LTLADKQAVNTALLRSGAAIGEMNTVRKHLSAIQGGRLALASAAPVLALVVSDVTGDDPTHIASGPCAPDPTTFADAREILQRSGIRVPASIASYIERGTRGEVPESPNPGDAAFARVENRVIATAHASLMAAAAVVQARGITPMVLGDSVTGESSEVAKVYAALARQVRQHAHPMRPPVALISGGETTVTMRGKGRGGRCSEFLLSLAIELEGCADTWALAGDTDGIDGSEENAGAVLAPDSMARARALGLAPRRLLADNDAHAFFGALGDLVTTGPTRTNVNDYRIILVR